jgi:hypothetical protein
MKAAALIRKGGAMKRAFNGLLIAVSLMVLVSCDALFLTNVTVDFDYQKFNEEKALWNSLKPSNYQYNLEHWNNGFSMPVDTLIIVENGGYKTQIPYHGSEYDYESQFYLTITEVYESIEGEYKEYHNTKQSKIDGYLKKIEIKYDAENHIPVEIKEYYYVSPIVADAPSYGETKITEYKINH